MSVTVTALAENASNDIRLKADFGISLLVEHNGRKILFDTATNGHCRENAICLGKNLNEIDAVVISHGHCDHANGLVHLIEEGINNKPLYVHKDFFCERYWDQADVGNPLWYPTSTALSPAYLAANRITYWGVFADLHRLFADENIYLMANVPRVTDFETICPSDYVKRGGDFTVDDYRDELYLVIDDEDGLVVISGCGHVGPVNICKCASMRFNKPVKAFVGGTHLMAFGEDRTAATCDFFKTEGTPVVAIGHCTGPAALAYFEDHLDAFVPVHTGTVLDI